MTKNNEQILKITLSAVLAALSIVLKLTFDLWVKTDLFGFPFYGIPLIISGFLLGPYYALLIAIVADTIGGIIVGYKPMFIFSTIVWSVVPCLLIKETKGAKWYVVIFLTYLMSTILNTGAIWFHFSRNGAIASLPTRLSVLPGFTVIIAIVTGYTLERLKGTQFNFIKDF